MLKSIMGPWDRKYLSIEEIWDGWKLFETSRGGDSYAPSRLLYALVDCAPTRRSASGAFLKYATKAICQLILQIKRKNSETMLRYGL